MPCWTVVSLLASVKMEPRIGPDARRPADGEREPDGEGADEARGLALDVQLLGPPEETDAQHPRDVQPEDHDEAAARDADPVAVVEQELTGRAEGRAEAHEDGGEAGDERDASGASTRVRVAESTSPARRSTDIPVMKERYDGNSGRTHGERNENSPAENATATPSDSVIARAPT